MARGPIDQMIFVEESHWAVLTSAPHLEQCGPDHHVPRHRGAEAATVAWDSQGEVHFSIGYTEPSAGTDLASLTTEPCATETSM